MIELTANEMLRGDIMKMKIVNFTASLLISIGLLYSTLVYAEDLSMSQVYETAKSGNLVQAETMMRQVLRDHPNSAKAHFVNAEILAKEHKFAEARVELGIAKQLKPDNSYAKAEALSELEHLLQPQNSYSQPGPNTASSNILTWVLAVIGFLVAIVILRAIFNFFSPRPVATAPIQTYPNSTMGGAGYGPNYSGMGGPSMGSGILGGLATGVAVGAGVVVGEELMHHVLDGNHPQRDNYVPDNLIQDDTQNYGMGGNDFGTSDSSSWDDSGSSGDSSDW